MRIALALLALAVACKTPREHLVTAGIGAGAAIGGLILIKADSGDCNEPDETLCSDGPTDGEALGAVLLVGGLITTFIALITYPYDPDPPKPATSPPPAQ